MGRNAVAAVNQRGNRGCQLNGRYLEGLAKGYGRQLHQTDVFRLVHDSPGLSRQIHICFGKKPELVKISVVIVRSQPQPHRNEYGVAGVHGSLDKVFCPVT